MDYTVQLLVALLGKSQKIKRSILASVALREKSRTVFSRICYVLVNVSRCA